MTDLFAKVLAHKSELMDLVAYGVLACSIIIKLTPTLKDDNFLKPIVKFVGKYLALDKYGPKGA